VVTVEAFQAVIMSRMTGISKAGFQGVIKRHGKAGGPASHGSRFHRTTGSIGQRTSPVEVFKNIEIARPFSVMKNGSLSRIEGHPGSSRRKSAAHSRRPFPGAKTQLVVIREAIKWNLPSTLRNRVR
jgi:large subunit ribosomal protein L3